MRAGTCAKVVPMERRRIKPRASERSVERISATLPKELTTVLDDHAGRLRVSRSHLMATAVAAGLSTAVETISAESPQREVAS